MAVCVRVGAQGGAGDKRDVRSRRDELASAAKGEAHKLQRIQEALAALAALPETGVHTPACTVHQVLRQVRRALVRVSEEEQTHLSRCQLR